MLGQYYFVNVAFVRINPLLVISHQGPKCGGLVYWDQKIECRLCEKALFYGADIKITQSFFPVQSLRDIKCIFQTMGISLKADIKFSKSFEPDPLLSSLIFDKYTYTEKHWGLRASL